MQKETEPILTRNAALHSSMDGAWTGFSRALRFFGKGNLSQEKSAKLSEVILLAGLTAGYALAARIGLSFAFLDRHASAVWPPTGLALAGVLLLGKRIWPAIFLGALIAYITISPAPAAWANGLAAVGMATGNTLEALAGAWLVERYAKGAHSFDHPRGVFQFLVLTAALSTLLSPAIGLTSLWITGLNPAAPIGRVWCTWWLGDMVSAATLAPLVLLLSCNPWPVLRSVRLTEGIVLLMSLVLAGLVFFRDWLLGKAGAGLAFLVIPILLWTALRFGRRGAIVGGLVVAGFAIRGALLGTGPFGFADRNTSLLLTQAFIGVVTVMALMLAADVHERKRVESDLRGSAEQIERLNQDLERRVRERTAQLESINRELEAFCYSVSHDLRAPLRSIRGFTEVLLERYAAKLDSRGQEFLRRTCESSQTMDILIEDLLKLSRVTRSELQRRPVNLSQLVESIAGQLRQEEPERAVEFVISPNLMTEGDEQLLRVVLDNLLRNAWKFTSKRLDARIEFGADQNPVPSFFIKDNGVGFDMAYAGKLFGVFQRLHSSAEFSGTGVGLATVQRIVNRHGGRAWATAEIDRGATFYFTLRSDWS